jgi:two-component system response regulator HydG
MIKPGERGVKLLVVDDDSSHRTMLAAVLGEEGYEVTVAAGGEEALGILGDKVFDLVLLDLRMDGKGGMEVLGEVSARLPGLAVVMMTAYASVETAVEALKMGARDYLTKPLDTDELKLTVARVLDHSRLETENRELRARLKEEYSFGRLVGTDSTMAEVVETLRRVAPTEATLLVLGESGTGKELAANAVHENSPRSSAPFVAVNCAAIPETLLESELFGYEKGAFTGAVGRKEGKIASAHGGTLFLDEVAEMSPSLQAKMLRFLQEREIQPLGSGATRVVDVRIIAATNRDLEEEVRQGRFREDLFYRLNVVPVKIPPLRERREDIPLLAQTFFEAYREKHRQTVKSISPEAVALLREQPWPGNVRELENSIERAVVLCRGDLLGPEDLFPGQPPTGGEDRLADPYRSGLTLREAESEIMKLALERAGGNKTLAAKKLGVSRQTLINKLKATDGGSDAP